MHSFIYNPLLYLLTKAISAGNYIYYKKNLPSRIPLSLIADGGFKNSPSAHITGPHLLNKLSEEK